jgi:cell division protein FtsB
LSKAANIYWDNANGTSAARRTVRRRKTQTRAQQKRTPWWLSFLIVAAIFTMLMVSINFRAFSEMSKESDNHARLSSQIQNLMDENLALQEEIHNLKTNREVIRREANRLGLREKQVLGPTN